MMKDTLVGIANWSSVEFAMAVICASLPTMRPLVQRLRPSFWQNKSAGQSSGRSRIRQLLSSHKQGEEYERFPGVGNDAFAMHYLPGHVEPTDHGSYGERKIVVTNTFSTAGAG